MPNGPLGVARAALQAYADKDRAAIESLIDASFHFTSPLDNALDRATYFARCWPNSASMKRVDVVQGVEAEDKAFIVYEVQTIDGKRFRNCELHTARDGKLLAVEVYFGWDLPHKAAKGGYIESP
jgi:hypothetical protein